MLVGDTQQCVQGRSSSLKSRNESLKKQMEYVCSLLAEWLILQASHPVFEGDDVDLRCRGKNEEDINEKIYYRNQKEIGRHLSKFTLRSVSRDKSEYHCTASGESFWGPWEETSKPLNIQVQGNGHNPVGNWSWQGNCGGGVKEGVLVSGDFMRGLSRASMGRRWEVVPSPWVPTS